MSYLLVYAYKIIKYANNNALAYYTWISERNENVTDIFYHHTIN